VKTRICGLCLGFAVLVAAFALPAGGSAHRRTVRLPASDPSVQTASTQAGVEWQLQATHADAVPPAVRDAAGRITLAIVDTGADVSAPALAAKAPLTYDVRTGSASVPDRLGHGTLVAALAEECGARLLIVKADGPDGRIADVDEAKAIRYAVDHGARIVNLSFAGPTTSAVERKALASAAAHGVLVVAAAGNEGASGNAPQYPAALMPSLARTRGGAGLAVAASTSTGTWATFSSQGGYVSLAAPGANVFTPFGFASGTSFAAPQVAGAAALVWAADASLRASDVASILERTASGRGSRTPALGYGVIDVAAAVAAAALNY
jgi:subtilisin family serine protease